MGPWFALDEDHPTAPGVSWEKFVTLIQRGKVGPTSVVRGPATGGLWRLARDAPAVATQLGMCWSCHAALADLSQARCDRCGATTNRPVSWAEPQAAPAAPDDEPDEAIMDLIRSAPAPRGAGTAPAGRRTASRLVTVGGTFFLIAAMCALVFYLGMETYGRFRGEGRGGAAGAGRPATPPPWEGAVSARPEESAPAGAAPEMFPKVLPYREVATRPAMTPAPPVEPAPPAPAAAPPTATAPDTLPLPAPPVAPPPTTRRQPAVRPQAPPREPPELARQRQSAADLYRQALNARDQGDLTRAQIILMGMLNNHERSVWPEGAEETLKAIQQKTSLASRPAEEPSPAELARQRQSASDLYQKAIALEGQGDLAGAQDLLLKVLNLHHPKAWPAAAQEAFARLQKALTQPSTRPRFFGTEAKQ
jgi:hypothetical protein